MRKESENLHTESWYTLVVKYLLSLWAKCRPWKRKESVSVFFFRYPLLVFKVVTIMLMPEIVQNSSINIGNTTLKIILKNMAALEYRSSILTYTPENIFFPLDKVSSQ